MYMGAACHLSGALLAVRGSWVLGHTACWACLLRQEARELLSANCPRLGSPGHLPPGSSCCRLADLQLVLQVLPVDWAQVGVARHAHVGFEQGCRSGGLLLHLLLAPSCLRHSKRGSCWPGYAHAALGSRDTMSQSKLNAQ